MARMEYKPTDCLCFAKGSRAFSEAAENKGTLFRAPKDAAKAAPDYFHLSLNWQFLGGSKGTVINRESSKSVLYLTDKTSDPNDAQW